MVPYKSFSFRVSRRASFVVGVLGASICAHARGFQALQGQMNAKEEDTVLPSTRHGCARFGNKGERTAHSVERCEEERLLPPRKTPPSSLHRLAMRFFFLAPSHILIDLSVDRPNYPNKPIQQTT